MPLPHNPLSLGTLPLFYVQRTWANEVIHHEVLPIKFTQICVYLAIICCIGYYSTTKKLHSLVQEKYLQLPYQKRNSDPALKPLNWYQTLKDHSISSKHNIYRTHQYALNKTRKITGYIHQLWRRSNFRIYAAVNLIQTLHCHFNSNFFPLFLGVLFHESVKGKDVGDLDAEDGSSSSSVIPTSWLLVISFILPHVLNLYNLKLVERFGAYQVITIMFMFKVLAGVILFFCTVNSENPESIESLVLLTLLIGYIIFNRVWDCFENMKFEFSTRLSLLSNSKPSL